MKKRIVFSISSVVFLAAALITAVGFLATHGWFGAGDLSSFFIWSLILTVPVVLLGAVYGRIAKKLNRVAAFFGAAVVGGILGYLSTLAVWKMLGPWFGAFSFPVFYCWLAGAIAACAASTALERKKEPNQTPEPTAPSGRGSS